MGSIGIESQTKLLDIDVLIIGAGPSGAALACFLGSHGGCTLSGPFVDLIDQQT